MTAPITVCLDTPDGPFFLQALSLADAHPGALLASGWGEPPAASPLTVREGRLAGCGRLIDAVLAYYDGDLAAPGAVPVGGVPATPFRRLIWDTLRTIGPGERLSYAELAARAGRPTAVRAAAAACGANPTPLFVPCHRVIRADGRAGGFRYGEKLKQSLLRREASTAGAVAAAGGAPQEAAHR